MTPGRDATPSWILCHGTPLTPTVWDAVAEVLRGGGSVWQPSMAPAAPAATLVTTLAQGLVDELPPGGGAHLVGHSFGGQVAVEAALLAGPLVESLTLICSRDTPYPPFKSAARALRSGIPPDLDEVVHRWFRSDEVVETDPVVRYARECLRDADLDAWADCLEAIAGFDRSGAVSSLTVPVHLIAAELDQVSTVAVMTAMARRLQRPRLTVVADAAHLSIFRRPTMLAELITSPTTRGSAQARTSR